MSSTVYVSLGSNLGNRMEAFRSAILKMKQRCLSNIKETIVIENQAILLPGSPKSWDKPFLNMVIKGETDFSPHQFLSELKKIEIELGRPKVHEKWCPRVIDLDILLWKGIAVNASELTVPHKELLNRPFLLYLLALIDPDVVYSDDINNAMFNVKISDLARKSVDFKSLFSRSFVLSPKLVGIVNITPDSFSDGNKHFKTDEAINHAISLIQQGATAVELGPQSLRVGAELSDDKHEWARLEPVLSGLEDFQAREGYKITISIETLSPMIVQKVIKRRVSWINDVANKWDESTLRTIAESKAKIVPMHSLDVPPKLGNIIKGNAVDEINTWAQDICRKLYSYGFTKDQIILDPGLGFGKDCYQNLELLRNVTQLKQMGCEVMIGHSRKSYLNAVTQLPPCDRDIETIAISSKLIDHDVDYLRVHNVEDHQRFFTASTLI